ncbi:MAG TPA: hypothetical protein VHG93_03385 [Longimicrobium sp.]|nr:hypothetical protein [Longimicrobium sp.]
MRTLSIFTLFSLAASAPAAAAQGILLPVGCADNCGAASLAIDSVRVWANLERGRAVTYINHVFRNHSDRAVDAALLFPVPADAEVFRASVQIAEKLTQYNDWSGPDESRWIALGLAGERPDAGLREYAAARVAHFPVKAIPPRGTVHMQIAYTQPVRSEGGTVTWRYPLSLGAAASPIGHLRLGMQVKTEAGFREVTSPSHAVAVQWGQEPGPCQPEERCGIRGYPSERVRVIRLLSGDDARARDFELVYTPRPVDRSVDAATPRATP